MRMDGFEMRKDREKEKGKSAIKFLFTCKLGFFFKNRSPGHYNTLITVL